MDESRIELHETLCGILGVIEPDGDRHVYFQPPTSTKMKYPAIKYSRRKIDNTHANNKAYMRYPSYEVILIDKNPDSQYFEKILNLPYCQFDRTYESDNLNHFVFILYYN